MALTSKDLDQVRPEVQKLAAATKGERSQISFAIDKRLHSALKVLAIREKVTLQQLVLDALIEHQKKLQ